MKRLAPQPGERIDRDQTVAFTFDGKRVTALAGDTIGSALYAAGTRTFSRSFKYHRRRGLMCCAGQCPNCLVAVDGAPGVRACTEPAREGARVEHLNARPSLEFDAMSVTDSIGGPAPSSAAGELAGGEERRVCAIPAPAPVPATAKPKRWSITNANTRRQGLISYSNDQW